MKKVSLVMIVKNEEKFLKRCLDSAKNSVDEIIVVDTGSTDRTKEIATSCGANVYDFHWIYDFSAARNYGLSKATGDWILVLDADEYLEKTSKDEIQTHINKGTYVGRISIKSKFEDNGETQESIANISRIFPKGILFEGRIHEQLKTDLPRINTAIKVLHDGYFQTDKTERNISLLEKELELNPNDPYYLFQAGKEYRKRKDYHKAIELFSLSYKLLNKKESFAPNVILEYLNSLINTKRYIEALNITSQEKNYLNNHPDFHFKKGILLMNYLSTKPNPTINEIQEIENSFLRCLEIGVSHENESVIGTGTFLAAFNLGVYYELFSLNNKAKYYYKIAAQYDYKPAIERLKLLN